MVLLYALLYLGFFGLAVLLLIQGILLQRMARHIRAQHPNLWKQLRSPDLNTAQGSRSNSLVEWIGKEKYLRIQDPWLHQRGPLLKKLIHLSFVGFITLFVSAVVVILFDQFILS